MSRAYLETLADLPWNAFSGQRREQMQDGAKPVLDEDQGIDIWGHIIHVLPNTNSMPPS